MSLKPLHIIFVGRPRAKFWKDAAAHYLERLGHWRRISETVIRDADSLPPVLRGAEEGKRILGALTPQDIPICLAEHGNSMSSVQFSQFLEDMSSNMLQRPCFILGGPFGLDQKVLDKAKYVLALGPQTLPHELARVVLLEQLYRAETILRNIPYHHK